MPEQRPPLPPFTREAAIQKIRAAEDGWNSCNPERVSLAIQSAGTLNAVMWVQELWFNDFLIWSTEVFSPLASAIPVRAGEKVAVALDDAWRSTNSLSI